MMFRCILFFVLLYGQIPQVDSQEPQIVEEILPEVKLKGHSGYLNCTVARQGENKVMWVFGVERHISSDTDILVWNQVINGKIKYEVYRQSRGNDKTVYTLVVNRLREEDDGRYVCKIYLQGYPVSKWPMKFTTLTVQVPPTIVVSATTNTQERRQGSEVVFRCNATGAPTPNITWIRADGKPLHDGRLSHRGREYVIPSIQKKDRGVYRCVGDNTVPPAATHDAKLVVFYSPESMPVQDTVGQAQNRRYSATVECIIEGMPEPNLRWYRETNEGNVLITDNDKYQISQLLNHGSALQTDEIWYSLKILNIQANDYTNYICEGRNNINSSRAKILLYETNICQGTGCSSADTASMATTTVKLEGFVFWLSTVSSILTLMSI